MGAVRPRGQTQRAESCCWWSGDVERRLPKAGGGGERESVHGEK